jgi:hypothetical protein
MTSLCTVIRSSASFSTKNSYDFHCRRYHARTARGVFNSPQWSDAIVHRCKRSFKWQRAMMSERLHACARDRSRRVRVSALERLSDNAFSRPDASRPTTVVEPVDVASRSVLRVRMPRHDRSRHDRRAAGRRAEPLRHRRGRPRPGWSDAPHANVTSVAAAPSRRPQPPSTKGSRA